MTFLKHVAVLAVVCTLLAAAVGLRAPVTSAAAPAGSLVSGMYAGGAAGTLSYEVYVPAAYASGTAVPLLVALHGCSESADQFRRLTRFDQLADAKDMIVVFPDESSYASSANCWNWFRTEHMKRGAGEPALIAGLTQWVCRHYSIDPHRIYAAGLSAGGAMASVMAATYPDVFAASGIGSGCEYGAGTGCAGYRSVDPEKAGRQAYEAMGSRARVVSVIIFQGDQDKTVPPVNSQQLVQQWQATDDWADDGARDHSVPSAPADTVDGTVPGGRTYTVAHYSDGHGGELIEFWVVHGMGHAWSGGCGCESYADPAGPDATGVMYAFFMHHPLP